MDGKTSSIISKYRIVQTSIVTRRKDDCLMPCYRKSYKICKYGKVGKDKDTIDIKAARAADGRHIII